MAEFTITLTGEASADDVRLVFEQAARSLRAVLAEFEGELTVDGVTESTDDVSDDAAPDEVTDETDDQTADEDATEEATPEEAP